MLKYNVCEHEKKNEDIIQHGFYICILYIYFKMFLDIGI